MRACVAVRACVRVRVCVCVCARARSRKFVLAVLWFFALSVMGYVL